MRPRKSVIHSLSILVKFSRVEVGNPEWDGFLQQRTTRSHQFAASSWLQSQSRNPSWSFKLFSLDPVAVANIQSVSKRKYLWSIWTMNVLQKYLWRIKRKLVRFYLFLPCLFKQIRLFLKVLLICSVSLLCSCPLKYGLNSLIIITFAIISVAIPSFS